MWRHGAFDAIHRDRSNEDAAAGRAGPHPVAGRQRRWKRETAATPGWEPGMTAVPYVVPNLCPGQAGKLDVVVRFELIMHAALPGLTAGESRLTCINASRWFSLSSGRSAGELSPGCRPRSWASARSSAA